MIVGLGLDVVAVPRVEALLAEKGDRALARLFTDGERRYCEARAVPARHFAARVAAKEAAFKALSGTEGARGIGWREIEVTIDSLGRPRLVWHARAAERVAELRVARAWITLTHEHELAIAVVVLERGE